MAGKRAGKLLIAVALAVAAITVGEFARTEPPNLNPPTASTWWAEGAR
jgi:hypothetical protein